MSDVIKTITPFYSTSLVKLIIKKEALLVLQGWIMQTAVCTQDFGCVIFVIVKPQPESSLVIFWNDSWTLCQHEKEGKLKINGCDATASVARRKSFMTNSYILRFTANSYKLQ